MTAIKTARKPHRRCTQDKSIIEERIDSRERENDTNVSSVAPVIENAKSRFIAAVSKTVEELQEYHGFNRRTATGLLLRKIRRDDSPPTDDEIFHVMQSLNMGMDDASKTVTVARALRRARTERGLSAVDAIDDLTSLMSVSSLLREAPCSPDPEKRRVVGSSDSCSWSRDRKSQSQKASQVCGVVSISHKSVSSLKNNISRGTQRSSKAKISSRVPSNKISGRKRSFLPSEDITKAGGRTGALAAESGGSVPCVIDGPVVKKTKFSDEGGKSSSPHPTVRSKRSVSHRGDDQQLQSFSAGVKRTRSAGDE